MTALHRGLLMGLAAVTLFRLGIGNEHLLFVKPSMQPWLVVSAVALAALAVLQFADLRGRRGAGQHTHEGDHPHTERIGLLLLVPFLAIFVVPTSPLGAHAASLQSTRQPPPAPASFPPLPAPDGDAVDLSLTEFVQRDLHDPARSMGDLPIRLTGFVTEPEDDGFLLTRFAMTCCAADGVPLQVVVRGVAPPPEDTWVRVEGTWEPSGGHPGARAGLAATTLAVVERPTNPYE